MGSGYLRSHAAELNSVSGRRGGQTRGQSQGHCRRHNELNLSLHRCVASSRGDNNAFNFGLPSILCLCIGAVAALWLPARSGCGVKAFSITREKEEGKEVWESTATSVNYSVVLSQPTDKWTSNQNGSN